MDLFRKCMDPVEKVLRDAKMDKGHVNEVVLVSPSNFCSLCLKWLPIWLNCSSLMTVCC